MPCIGLEIEDTDDDLDGFNAQARQKLAEVVGDFAQNVIKETRRLEGYDNTTGNPPEITSNMVREASYIVKRPFRIRKPGFKTVLIKALSILLPFVTSLFFDKNKLQDTVYLVVIASLFAFSILAVILSFTKDNWDE